MIKVGILTYHFSDNYGALMQAYALRKWLLDRGVSANFINYHPTYVEEGGRFDRPWNLTLWRKNATILYMKLAKLQRRILGNNSMLAGFETFRRDYLGIQGAALRSVEELRSVAAKHNILVCGSDQIWNPSIHYGLDPVYFLDIPGTKAVHKIAYAPSFGRSEIEPKYYAELNKLISGLDAVSVREASGIEILESAGIAQGLARVMPDPTILLGHFDELIGKVSDDDGSVFAYALRTDQVIRSAAMQAAHIVGGQLYAPRNTHQRWRDIGEGVVPGPVEWLVMLARSRLVVSNSFHGVALSVVLNKPFIAVSLPGKRAALNARVQNLLKVAGLQDRVITTVDPERIRQLIEAPIDWEATNARVAAVRAEAETYLDAEIAAVLKGRR